MQFLLGGKPFKTIHSARWLNPILTQLKAVTPQELIVLVNQHLPISHTVYTLEHKKSRLLITLKSWRGSLELTVERLSACIDDNLQVTNKHIATHKWSDYRPHFTTVVSFIRHYLLNHTQELINSITVSTAPCTQSNYYGGKIADVTENNVWLENGMVLEKPILENNKNILKGQYLIFSHTGNSRVFSAKEFNQHFVLL